MRNSARGAKTFPAQRSARSHRSLEAAAQKVSLPSGWILTPFLGLKLSILWFYAFAPILVLALHFELLTPRPAGAIDAVALPSWTPSPVGMSRMTWGNLRTRLNGTAILHYFELRVKRAAGTSVGRLAQGGIPS
jgi:hypothetical protein